MDEQRMAALVRKYGADRIMNWSRCRPPMPGSPNYYWLDDSRAPDFARTVDIHRKPGYDPAELFVDPALAAPKLKIACTVAKKALGFRYLLDVIPLDASLVRGSHGRITDRLDDGPVFISSEPGAADGLLKATSVRDAMLAHLFDHVPGTTR